MSSISRGPRKMLLFFFVWSFLPSSVFRHTVIKLTRMHDSCLIVSIQNNNNNKKCVYSNSIAPISLKRDFFLLHFCYWWTTTSNESFWMKLIRVCECLSLTHCVAAAGRGMFRAVSLLAAPTATAAAVQKKNEEIKWCANTNDLRK